MSTDKSTDTPSHDAIDVVRIYRDKFETKDDVSRIMAGQFGDYEIMTDEQVKITYC